jgi:predicted DNA-binding transcriptional regulator AlpA
MRVIRYAELKREKGIDWSRQWIFQLVRLGKFPPPIILGTGPRQALAWVESEVDEWLTSRPRVAYAPARNAVPAVAPEKSLNGFNDRAVSEPQRTQRTDSIKVSVR